MQGFIARRLLRNVAVAELMRRAFSTALRLAPSGLFLLLVLWLPVLALPAALALLLPSEIDATIVALLGPGTFASWSIIVTPLAAALLAGAAIRSAAGGRLPIREIFRGAWPALLAAFLPALSAGILTTVGFGFLIIPGFVIGAFFFVVGPVAAIERTSFMGSFRRSIELTRGNRFALFGVAFVIGFVESTFALIAAFFAGLADPLTAGLVWFAITLGGALWRATAAALAYADLRTAKENLEVDALAIELGGAPKKADISLSEDEIAALAKRRGVVGRLTGQSIHDGMSLDGIESVREMEMLANRRQRARRIVVAAIAGVVAIGTLIAGAFALYTRVEENRRLASYETALRTAETGLDSVADSDVLDSVRRDLVSRQILENIVATRPERRLELLGRLMAIHSDRFYGPGFAQAFVALGRGEESDGVLTALSSQIESNGCNDALASAKSDPENRGRAFAKACPPNDTSPLAARRFRSGLPLGRAAFAQLLELRARGRMLDSDGLHEATLKLLLAGG